VHRLGVQVGRALQVELRRVGCRSDITRVEVDSVARWMAAQTRAPTARIAVSFGWPPGWMAPLHPKTSEVLGRTSVPITAPVLLRKVMLVPETVPVKVPSDVSTVSVWLA
jgi:hypothetical protein